VVFVLMVEVDIIVDAARLEKQITHKRKETPKILPMDCVNLMGCPFECVWYWFRVRIYIIDFFQSDQILFSFLKVRLPCILKLPLLDYIIDRMLKIILRSIISAPRSHLALTLENLALRHQLNILQRDTKMPCFQSRDSLLWIIIARIWSDWRKSLTLVRPETVIRWHKKDSDTTGDGRADHVGLGDRKYPKISESLSAKCPWIILCGVPRGFTVNC